MYKEILIIAIIILVILSLNIITQNYTKDSVAILSEKRCCPGQAAGCQAEGNHSSADV